MIQEEINWITQALTLLENIPNFPKDAKLIMMLRHSEREPLTSAKKNSDLQLTEKGHLAALLFGEKIPLNHHVRLFYSNRDRCRDTTLDILAGYRSKGGNGIDGGTLEPLYALKVLKDNFFKNELCSFSLLEIMDRWINKQYDLNDIESIESYSKRAAHLIWTKFNEMSPKGGIDIHISHEVLLMALRSGWFNLNPNDKWTEFLGGYAFTFTKKYILLLDFDTFLKIPYPQWWNKKIFHQGKNKKKVEKSRTINEMKPS